MQNPALQTEFGGRRVEDGKLKRDQGELRSNDEEGMIDNSERRLEGC